MQSDVDIPKHRKKKPANKPFVIQSRVIGSVYGDKWSTYGKYDTEQRMQQAFKDLTTKNSYMTKILEFRIKPVNQ